MLSFAASFDGTLVDFDLSAGFKGEGETGCAGDFIEGEAGGDSGIGDGNSL